MTRGANKLVKFGRNRVVINFDGKFFRKENILRAAQAYTESCWMLVDGSDELMVAVLIPKEKGIPKERLKDEFYNYVLAVTKNAQFG